MGGGGNDAVKSTNINEIQILSAGYQKPAKTVKKLVFISMICRYIEEGVVGSGMGLFLIERFCHKTQEDQLNGVPFPPFAEICAGCPAISVSS